MRIAVLAAISVRKLEPFAQAILAAVRTDPSKAVRGQALALLVRHADAIDGASEAIAWAAKNDPDSEVRAAAQRALSIGDPATAAR